MNSLNLLVDKISTLPAGWHTSGSVSQDVLRAIIKHSSRIGAIKNTAETGSGKTTLLFSHLSLNHTVFAIDNWNSMSVVKNSELFNKERVTFIEGPTQKTLPFYKFSEKFDVVLLDGPHGYPFPELEYFYFYPYIKTDGLFLLDDIQIPTLKRMFQILKSDDMWQLQEVVDNFAIFKRTNAPMIDPYSDSWWMQGYNRSFSERKKRKQKLKNLLPKSLLKLTPSIIKRSFSKLFGSE